MLSMFSRAEDKPVPPKLSGPAKAPAPHAPKAAATASKPTIRLINQAAANANPPRPAPERQQAPQQSTLDRRTPSIGQYLHHLQHDIRSYVKAETLNAVIGTLIRAGRPTARTAVVSGTMVRFAGSDAARIGG